MRKNCFEALYFMLLIFCFFLSPTPILNADENKILNLEEMYIDYYTQPSDINEHLPVLRRLAAECSSVVEIGVGSIASTCGILQGLSESPYQSPSYLGINLAYPPYNALNLAQTLAEKNGINFTFWPVNDMHIFIEPTDMLFIDSLHTYCHLTYELETFSSQVRKYICLHGTSHPWGNQDDIEYYGNYSEYPPSYDRTKKGLWSAVLDFLTRNPEWVLLESHMNNHGFTILKRLDEKVVPEPFCDSLVDHYLKEKIILCTGPALGRYNMLKQSTEADLNLIPFKKIFLTTNDRSIMDITFHGKKPTHSELIPNRGKHLDCVNCIISTIKNAVNDPEVDDDDIILFKHESVFINDMQLIKKAINKIVHEGYDMIVRNMAQWSGITATDAFFIKVSAVREMIKNFSDINALPPNGWFCEAYFHQYIVKHIPNVYGIYYNHSNGDFTELGFYHIPSIPEATRPFWDRRNHDEIFNQPSYFSRRLI